MILILSDGEKENIGKALFEEYRSQNKAVDYLSVSSFDIKPCIGCEGCTWKTFGKCVFRDDMDIVMPKLLASDILILTSPLVWGGFTYPIKKILDKSSLIGDRFYHVKNGELVKGLISNLTKLAGVAVSGEDAPKSNDCFAQYIREYGIITDIKTYSKVLKPSSTRLEVEKLAQEVLNA